MDFVSFVKLFSRLIPYSLGALLGVAWSSVGAAFMVLGVACSFPSCPCLLVMMIRRHGIHDFRCRCYIHGHLARNFLLHAGGLKKLGKQR